MKFLLQFILIFISAELIAQYNEIPLVNPSFEGSPAPGTNQRNFHLGGWFDCAPYYFRGQTPPDVQPGSSEFFDVHTQAHNGNTYLGLVTRQNETWELVSQRLIMPLEKGKCYAYDIHLSRSETYYSALVNSGDTTKELNFNKPIVLRVWGGRNVYEKRELLAESPVIGHLDWKAYHFEFELKQNHEYLILEAFYKTPTLFPYNGNILLDDASNLREISCPGDEPVYASSEESKTEKDSQLERKRNRNLVKSKAGKRVGSKNKAREDILKKGEIGDHKPRILKQLDSKKIKEGQTIKIDQLYFEADSSNFALPSFKVLDEIYHFLNSFPNVVIEIGGHTNSIPGHKYCQTLSLKRAKSVAEYLYDKGIPKNRIIYKGYGKIKPIASNKTNIGRQKNQRVEIKILKVG